MVMYESIGWDLKIPSRVNLTSLIPKGIYLHHRKIFHGNAFLGMTWAAVNNMMAGRHLQTEKFQDSSYISKGSWEFTNGRTYFWP